MAQSLVCPLQSTCGVGLPNHVWFGISTHPVNARSYQCTYVRTVYYHKDMPNQPPYLWGFDLISNDKFKPAINHRPTERARKSAINFHVIGASAVIAVFIYQYLRASWVGSTRSSCFFFYISLSCSWGHKHKGQKYIPKTKKKQQKQQTNVYDYVCM